MAEWLPMRSLFCLCSALALPAGLALGESSAWEVTSEELRDRIQGGVLGQMLGNLNGLPHEFDYIDEPGEVDSYTPSLPSGAKTDDDTDIEWVYLIEMDRTRERFIPHERIPELWKAHINDWIWASTNYARQLMDLDLQPPHTGRAAFNPWSETNVSSQFLTEMFGLGAPGLPREACRMAVHHAETVIDAEPLQAAQFFAALVSLSFVERDPVELVRRSLPALDSSSQFHRIVEHVLELHETHPEDWRATRLAIRDTYTRFPGLRPDINGYALNGAATVAALLHGGGDFERTMCLAFNFGWDADNNAALCGTVLGVWKGRAWMDAQGWDIADIYRNERREGLPRDETITGYGDRVTRLAERSLKAAGAARDGQTWRIPVQPVTNHQPLVAPAERLTELREVFGPTLEASLTSGSFVDRARAVYVATLLDLDQPLREKHPGPWRWGVQRLERVAPGLVVSLYKSPKPYGDALRAKATRAGILIPKE